MKRFFKLAITGIFASLMPHAASADHPGGNPETKGYIADTDIGYVRHVLATVITEIPVTIANGEVLEIITANPEADGDPALHLLRADTREEVAFDDSTDGANGARLTYSASSGDFILVVRARTPDDGGVTRLFRGPTVWMEDVVFGGAQLRYDDLKEGETLQSVALPDGPASRHRLYLLDAASGNILPTGSQSAVGGALMLNLEDDTGTQTLLVGVQPGVAPGYVRIVRNDAALSGSDLDKDGLGSILEAEIGTCETTAQTVPSAGGETFDCRRAADPRDTDGDGLRDDWETLGLMRIFEREPKVRVHEALRLPAWGASPRHKDVFIEVDFMKRAVGEPVQQLTPARARAFAMNYNDAITNPTPEETKRRANTLANPDGLHGIRAHLDIGQAATNATDAVMFGDWGGFSATEPVQNSSGSVGGADYNTVWLESMSPNRRGIFRYLLGYDGGGGQTALNNYAATGPINGVNVLAHEFGHAMGMGHSGPPNATGVVDPNCMVNYPSIMNYAYISAGVGFSDGFGRPPLNNVALTEFEAVDPSNTRYLDDLENLFEYWVDRTNGHVDWNRDGEIAPAGKTVRAYANFNPGSSCEYTRYNKGRIDKSASLQSPGMTRLGGKLTVVFSVLGEPFFTRETARVPCAAPDVTPCVEWTVPDRISGIGAEGGIDIARINEQREEQAIVVAVTAEGSVMETRLTLDSNGDEIWSAPRILAEPGSAVGEPSLAKMGACGLYLAFRNEAGAVTLQRLTCADGFQQWGPQIVAADQNGDPIMLPAEVSPGIGRAYLDAPGRAELYGAFADPSSENLKLYRYSPPNEHWVSIGIIEDDSEEIRGRPSLIWVSQETDIDFPGRLYLLYVRRDTSSLPLREKVRPIRMMWSYTKVTETPSGGLTKDLRVGLESPFDNSWAYAFGVDGYFEAGVDTSLQTVHSNAINEPVGWSKLEYRPKADGTNDFEMRNFNDWDTMAKSLCRDLVDAGGLVTPAVDCP